MRSNDIPHDEHLQDRVRYQGKEISYSELLETEHTPLHLEDLKNIPRSLPIAGLSKIPIPPPPPPDLQSTFQDPNLLSPESRPSPGPSSVYSPQSPISLVGYPAPLHVKEEVEATPAPLPSPSSVFEEQGDFVNSVPREPNPCAQQPKRPTSSVLDRDFNNCFSLYEPTSTYSVRENDGFEAQRTTRRLSHIESLSEEDQKSLQEGLHLRSSSSDATLTSRRGQAGRYSHTSYHNSLNCLEDEQDVLEKNRNFLGEKQDILEKNQDSLEEKQGILEQRVNSMVVDKKVPRSNDRAFHSLAMIISVIAVAALILAVLAFSQIKGLKAPPTTILINNMPNIPATPSISHLPPLAPDSDANDVESSIATTTSTHDSSSQRAQSRTMTSEVIVQVTRYIFPTHAPSHREARKAAREEAIAFASSVDEAATTTVFITKTIKAASTGHHDPLSPRNHNVLAPTSSNIAARRYVAPLSWNNLKKWVKDSNTISTTTTSAKVYTTQPQSAHPMSEQLMHSAYANAATPRISLPWHLGGKRAAPTASGRRYTYREAYSILRNQAVQLCFATKTYLNNTLTPSNVKHVEDDGLGAELQQSFCNDGDVIWLAIPQGQRCDQKTQWIDLVGKVQALCGSKKSAPILGQGVELLCTVKGELMGNIDDCDQDQGSGNITVVPSSGIGGSSTGPTKSSIAMTTAVISPLVLISKASNTYPSPTPSASTQQLSTVGQPTFAPAPPTVPPAPPISNTVLDTTSSPALLPHAKLTPPPDWDTKTMITYTSHARSSDYSSRYYSSNTIPSSLSTATPPVWTGPVLSRTWLDNYPFPIPTGYVAPNIVPRTRQIGHLTYFNNGTGACGLPAMQSNKFAVAISWVLFDLGREIGGSVLENGWDETLENRFSRGSSALCNR
jgi:hypothetical protein